MPNISISCVALINVALSLHRASCTMISRAMSSRTRNRTILSRPESDDRRHKSSGGKSSSYRLWASYSSHPLIQYKSHALSHALRTRFFKAYEITWQLLRVWSPGELLLKHCNDVEPRHVIQIRRQIQKLERSSP